MFNYYSDPINGIWGIYEIRNKENDISYLGKHQDILTRWDIYKYKLNHNTHHNQGLQFDWNLYGESCFEFNILSRLSEKDKNLSNLAWLEDHYIYDVYKDKKLYNIRTKREEALWYVCQRLLEYKINFKFKEKIDKNLLDFIICEDNKLSVIDIHDLSDTRGLDKSPKSWDQNTIENRKRFCDEKGINFQLLDTRCFYSDYRMPVKKHSFQISI